MLFRVTAALFEPAEIEAAFPIDAAIEYSKRHRCSKTTHLHVEGHPGVARLYQVQGRPNLVKPRGIVQASKQHLAFGSGFGG